MSGKTRWAGIAALVAIVVGCQSLPVGQGDVTTVPPDIWAIKERSIDKVDLLFAIDNSASMADKQELFRDAVPHLIARLLTPDCVDDASPTTLRQAENPDGTCAAGLHLEFPRVHDLHLGIVTSSLGGGGSPDVCDGASPVPAGTTRHDNDKGELVNRVTPNGGAEGRVTSGNPVDGTGGNFLAWLPPSDPLNQGKPAPNVTPEPDLGALTADFQTLVVGAQEYGCGLEAQLESWYRFLVQPDPWDDVPKAVGGKGVTPNGVDLRLLKQRKDFLREDSLVAVVMLTDEEDSWSDPLALGGRGWVTRTAKFPTTQANEPGTMPRGTSECNVPTDANNPTTTGPNDKACTSCGFQGNKPGGGPIAADPECQKACGAGCIGFYPASEDGLNVRYTNDMKRRYGFDPQFPVPRYVDGLTSLKVPNREGEHKGGTGPYLGTKNYTNPLFARDLPDGSDDSPDVLCNLKIGSRTPDLVFFAVLGGVPWQLLVDDPTSEASAYKMELGDADWVKILGKDPATYQSDGIDPHMLESIGPRVGLPPPSASNDSDPIHGREWNTQTVPGLDLQYACTFPLQVPKDCTSPKNALACDCASASDSPLCSGTTQVRGKAYPTIRELRVAKAMGARGIPLSVCARNVKDSTAASYGYRPAMDAIVARMRGVLAGDCLPKKLVPGPDGLVTCRVLVELQPGTDPNLGCDPARGLAVVEPAVAQRYRSARLAELKAQDPKATLADVGPVCVLAQLKPSQNGTCAKSLDPGWCYVTGAAAGTCPQKLVYTRGAGTSGRVTLDCE